MKILKMIALLGFAAVAPQAQSLLWSLDVANYEVQVPVVATGTCGGPSTCPGWWYGYNLTKGDATTGDWAPKNADGSLMLTDTSDGSKIVGGNLTATGLKIQLIAPAAKATDKPGLAGIGFGYQKPDGPENITAFGGYIVTYTSDLPLQLELGWDEATNGYDTWYAALPAHATSSALSLPWAVFKKDGWATGTASHLITVAETGAYSAKFRLKNSGTVLQTCNFEIQKLTSLVTDPRIPADPTPGAILAQAQGTSLKANLMGHTLSFSGLGKASVSVEVIGLQGQVVASQMLSSASHDLDLSKLSNGVYVVKAASKAINFSKMIALK